MASIDLDPVQNWNPRKHHASWFSPDEDRTVNVVLDLDGNKGKSSFCKHALLQHGAMLGKADNPQGRSLLIRPLTGLIRPSAAL